MVLVERHQFTGAESSYTFANIPQTGSALVLDFFGRGTPAAAYCVTFTVNGDNGAIYSIQRQYAQSTTPGADQDVGVTSWGRISASSTLVCAPGSTWNAGLAAGGELTIHGYTSDLNKTVTGIGRHTASGTTSAGYVLSATGEIATSAPITSLTISGGAATVGGGNFTSDSYAALYVRQ